MMAGPERKPTTTLLSDALDQSMSLVRGEIALAKTELRSGIRKGLTGTALVLSGSVLLMVALTVLASALVAALIDGGFSPASAALLVAGGLIIVAAILIWSGSASIAHLSDLSRRTTRRLAQDAETLKEGMSDDHAR